MPVIDKRQTVDEAYRVSASIIAKHVQLLLYVELILLGSLVMKAVKELGDLGLSTRVYFSLVLSEFYCCIILFCFLNSLFPFISLYFCCCYIFCHIIYFLRL